MKHPLATFLSLGLVTLAALACRIPILTAEDQPVKTWRPVESTASGLLLQPTLDLSMFTTEEFLKVSASVGPEKIRKVWTSAVTILTPHTRPAVRGLTEREVQDYMRLSRRMFDDGAANPVSDVGLISTQEDVIRQPMYNHIAVFSNEVAHVYLLVQKTAENTGWGYFSIVQDRTTDPPTDYFAEIQGDEVKLEGTSCYKCHSSGPLAIHPARADLVSDAALATAISQHIADLPHSQFHFPENSPRPESGKPMALKACTECHDEGGVRAPLFQVQSHPIRVLVDFGYMPPDRRLSSEEIGELKAWLEEKH